jgi:glycerate kinase
MTPAPAFPQTVLVAPDSFKGTLAAAEVAAAIGEGLRRVGLEPDPCPVADGGEGTLGALLPALGLELVEATASDPLGRPIEASFGIGRDRGIVVIETAAASGLALIEENERDAWSATTAGTGELIVAAVAEGARSVLVAAGGSATSDGGAGALEAIDAAGGIGEASLVVLCDVRTPYEQAAEVFGPQKGADPAVVAELTDRLHELARGLPRDPRGVPMTGCAGGLSGALWARHDAMLVPGAAWVLDALGVERRMRRAVAVLSGEGKLDEQTAQGKLVGEIGARARAAGIPLHAIVGTDALPPALRSALGLTTVSEAGTLAEIADAAAEVGRREVGKRASRLAAEPPSRRA